MLSSPVKARALRSHPFSKYLSVFLIGIAFYVQLASNFSFTGTGQILRMEVPILAYLYGLSFLWLGRCDSTRKRAAIAALPLVTLYLAFDAYYMLFGKIPAFAEVSEIPELLAVLEPRTLALAGILVASLAGVYLFYTRVSLQSLLATAPLAGLAISTVYFPSLVKGTVETLGAPLVEHSIARNVARNGRIVMAFYYEAKRRVNSEKVGAYAGLPTELRKVFSPAVAKHFKPRDVFVLVLESFVDPNLFLELHGGPFGDDHFLRKYGPHQGFSFSPVFGGSTSQAEFEVLCGVPAFHAIDSIEFNVFTGHQVSCLPKTLRELGYEAISTNAYRPDFFNAYNAYRGLGFTSLNFPKEYMYGRETYLSAEGVFDDYMFDGDLYGQNLAYLKGVKQQTAKPLFSYVLGIYGHYPFHMDTARHPQVYSLKGASDQLRSVVNQYYYRTRALASYLDAIQELSPDALVVVVSDHLPTFGTGKGEYERLRYLGEGESVNLNRVLILDQGKAVQVEKIYHFNIPNLILDRLSGGAYCREAKCDFSYPQPLDRYQGGYYALMANAAADQQLPEEDW